MSVITEADRARDDVKQCVYQALQAIRVATDADTWGWDEWTEEYRLKLAEVQFELNKIYIKL